MPTCRRPRFSACNFQGANLEGALLRYTIFPDSSSRLHRLPDRLVTPCPDHSRFLRCLLGGCRPQALPANEVADPTWWWDTSSLLPDHRRHASGQSLPGPATPPRSAAAPTTRPAPAVMEWMPSTRAVGPDLLRMDRACSHRRSGHPRDAWSTTTTFLKSVQEGKTRVGVVHMPAWEGGAVAGRHLTIRSFLESCKP